MLLAAVSLAAVVLVAVAFKELVLVAFDAAFAAAIGRPVGLVDAALVALMAVMVVVGLPAAGAVLVTALVVIPPVAARQWTSRVGPMLLLAGLFGLAAAVAGVVVSTLRPGLSTGPLVVLAAAAICFVSFLVAPERGWLVRRMGEADRRRRWTRGRLLEESLRLGGDEATTDFERPVVIDCSPMLGVLSLNAIFASDRVLIPISADYLAVQGVLQVERRGHRRAPTLTRTGEGINFPTGRPSRIRCETHRRAWPVRS
jgi:hypothetical protein